MKTLTLIILLLLIIPQSKGQDVMNPYILDAPIYYPYPSYPLINDLTIFPPSWATQNDPSFKLSARPGRQEDHAADRIERAPQPGSVAAPAQ